MDAKTHRLLTDLLRRVENIVRDGTVAEANYPAARIRVQYADLSGVPVLTDWIPWVAMRAGSDRDWWAPDIGEQVTLLSPGGDLAKARALPSLYQTAHPAPDADPAKRRTQFGDGSVIEYDRAAHRYTITVNGGDVMVNATGNLDAVVGGNADITAGGDANIDASAIHLNEGSGVVTGECVCQFTGRPHSDVSTQVTAGK